MEEIEAPTEAVSEEIHHHAQHATEKWFSHVALSSAVFAVFAALAALLSNHHANEAMIDQIQASDHWGYYQAKTIKAAVLSSKMDMLAALGKKASKQDLVKVSEYRREQEEIAENAKEKEEASENHLKHHVVLARGVTLFQVAIAISAISVLTRRRRFWLASLGFCAVGLGFVAQALLL